MSFRRVSIRVAGRDVEAFSQALLAAGALSVDVADADAGTPAEQASFGEPGMVQAPWARAVVTALLDGARQARPLLAQACRNAGIAVPQEISVEEVADQDWVRLTQSQFQPIRISAKLWIVPTWERSPDPAAVNLVLDPGAAFGTGSHATTRLCLLWLVENLRGGEAVLDYGCGSGILAIAALRLGATRATGIDIDPQAVLAARSNAMQNRVAAEFREPGDMHASRFDIVLANILANPLILLAPVIAGATRTGGYVVLSGVLATQAEEVALRYAEWYDMERPVFDEGWALLAGRRRA